MTSKFKIKIKKMEIYEVSKKTRVLKEYLEQKKRCRFIHAKLKEDRNLYATYNSLIDTLKDFEDITKNKL